ncbi:hypothetical protein D3093_19420 (plasmid) [Azospirillum argentinense]|uniref:Galactosyl transferase GMA12/MNN10 family protein n=1 Tax=Azospirillum argentinense TaxID=2970906 RepID=A0A4D8PFI6_9PROT|nr:glycosyltransferase family 77 protein [Azospirillum argentinense]QCN97413.1 hypothetical protein D3093_19420 [Azospirillum argentinense]
MPMSPDILVFSVALNHYDRIYDRNIASHRAYAARHGYDYVCVSRPAWTTVTEAVWLKIELLRSSLAKGYRWVLFVDADCELRATAPRVESVSKPDKSVYLAAGFSGNVNSGVIIARNDPAAAAFFDTVLDASSRPVPEMDWGENGHVIHVAKRSDTVGHLDCRWNNNADPSLEDFVRHYSAGGPMRPLYSMGLIARAIQLAVRVRLKLLKLVGRHQVAQIALPDRLSTLGERCRRLYPQF